MIDVNGKIKYSEIYLGGRNISKMYYGEHLVWPDEISPQSGKYRWYLTYIDGRSEISECGDGFSTLLSNDFSTVPEANLVEKGYVGECIDKLALGTNGCAFRGFKNIKIIDMSKSKLTEIPQAAFRFSKSYSNIPIVLEEIILNDGLKKLNDSAFAELTPLKRMTIPNSVENIASWAFSGCTSLQEITMPSSLVDSIGDFSNTFYLCGNLENVYNFENTKVTSISYMFTECPKLKNIKLPNTLTYLGNSSFNNCHSLPSINLDKVSYIGTRCFYKNHSLNNVVFNDYITNIGDSAFYECSGITNQIVIGKYITNIGNGAFASCKTVPSFKMLSTTPPILGGSYAFEDTNNCPIYVPCESVDAYKTATNWNRLADRIVGWDFTTESFCPIYDTIIDGDICEDDVLYERIVKRVSYDNGKTYYPIGEEKGSVIGECEDSNYLLYRIDDTGNYTKKFDCSSGKTVTSYIAQFVAVSTGSLGNQMSGIVKFGDCCTEIGSNAFNNWSNLHGVLTIPDNVKKIGTAAFTYCGGYEGLVLSNNLEEIGDTAFYRCLNMTGVLRIPDSVKKIGHSAFMDCKGFYRLLLGNSIEMIDRNVFLNCSGFTGNLLLPSGITSIGQNAFANCKNLSGELVIPDSVTEIDVGAFQNCSGLNGTLTIGKGMTSIETSVFCNCNFEVFDIHENIRNISNAFSGNTNLSKIIIRRLIPASISTTAFDDTNNCPIYVPCESLEAYKTRTNWTKYADRLVGWDFDSDTRCES